MARVGNRPQGEGEGECRGSGVKVQGYGVWVEYRRLQLTDNTLFGSLRDVQISCTLPYPYCWP